MTTPDLAGRLGLFARTFVRASAAEVADAVAGAGYALAHWNFAAIGRSTLAAEVTDAEFREVAAAFRQAGVGIPSASATFNLIHPDEELRRAQLAEAVELIGRIGLVGAEVVTLCTGTRDAGNMWRAHPGNTAPEAWRDLRAGLDVLLEAAAGAGIVLGVEPEAGNVVVDAPAAARLLGELGDGAPIGIVLDPANLLTPATLPQQERILTEAVELLGPRVVGAQAKDVVAGGYSAAGAGGMDYDLVFRLLARLGPVPLVVQDVTEADAARVREDLLHRHAAALVR